MPSAWLLGPFVIKSELVIIIGSFIIGFIYSYFFSPFSKTERRQYVEEVQNLFLMFILSLFIGKVILKFSLILRDPIAVLAYPSNSKAFYIALCLTAVFGFYRVHWFKCDLCRLRLLFVSFTVFLSASFSYELIYYWLDTRDYSWLLIVFLATLIVTVRIAYQWLCLQKVTAILILGWSVGQWVIAVVYKTAVFHFQVNSMFYVIIAIIGLILLFKSVKPNQRKNIIISSILVVVLGWAVYQQFSGELDNFKYDDNRGIVLKEVKTGIEIGNMAPNFKLNTLDGHSVQLSDYYGKPVMINFWATWCPPCRAEMPDMKRFHQDREVVILAINLTQSESSLKKVRQFVAEYQLNFPILLDENKQVGSAYKVIPIPTTYMVDSRGIVQYKSFGPINYEKMIQVLTYLD